MKAYGSIPSINGWTVGRCVATGGEMHAVSNVREFSTFEEADAVAKSMAAGNYPEVADGGLYVNMR